MKIGRDELELKFKLIIHIQILNEFATKRVDKFNQN